MTRWCDRYRWLIFSPANQVMNNTGKKKRRWTHKVVRFLIHHQQTILGGQFRLLTFDFVFILVNET